MPKLRLGEPCTDSPGLGQRVYPESLGRLGTKNLACRRVYPEPAEGEILSLAEGIDKHTQ
jgi:hypothetical protein